MKRMEEQEIIGAPVISPVRIGGEEYGFATRIGGEPAIVENFNRLAKTTFDLWFEQVGGDYEPYVLLKDGEVCANVSVNRMAFCQNGEPLRYIQLGTVMTAEPFRRRGLGRFLMERVLEEWENRCDGIYLFANDSVLEYYPKFDFVPAEEYEYFRTGLAPQPQELRRLSMDDPADAALALKKFREGNPFSALWLDGCEALFDFYRFGWMKEHCFYSASYDVMLMAEWDAQQVLCWDVFGQTRAGLPELLDGLAQEGKQLVLGFTPRETAGWECRVRREEDTTLFLRRGGRYPVGRGAKRMFPLVSHT